jgi:GTP pyrophosphokinase
VFCFTPKGRLIALPRCATAIDFAYAVHTDVGNSAVGAKINGRIAPLISELHNGDEVLISRAEGGTPPAAWDSVVVTGRARAAIRKATREAAKAQFGGLARQIVERAFERAGKQFTEAQLQAALSRLARASIDDVFIGVDGARFSRRTSCAPVSKLQGRAQAGRLFRKTRAAGSACRKQPISCSACQAHRTPVTRCRCAASASIRRSGSRPREAVPGEQCGRARGRRHRLLSDPFACAHPVRRPAGTVARRALGPENTPSAIYSTQIVVTLLNEPGALGVIATTIGEYGANIDAVVTSPSG